MKRRISLGMRALCATLLLLTGEMVFATGSPETPTAATEKSTLRIGVASMPGSFDAPREASNTGIRTVYNTFETLIWADPGDNYTLKPMLATSWRRISDTALELTLREGVMFHHGVEFTGRDVVASFERVLEPDSPYSLARSLLSVITEIETPDDYTVVVHTANPDPILEHRLASNWGAWIVPADPAADLTSEEFGQLGYGTGPFRLTEMTPEGAVLEYFEDYWGERPDVERVEYRLIPEFSARLTAIVNSEVDIIAQVPPDQIDALDSYGDVEVKGVNIFNMHMLIYNTTNPPLNDQRLRQALNMAIDRELLSETLWSGRAPVARSHQYPEYGDYYLANRLIPEYNPEQARRLITQSSYNGEEIVFESHPAYYTYGAEAAEAIVEMWKEVGINATLRLTESIEGEQVRNWSNTGRFPDPAGGLWLLWGADSGRQQTTWLDASDEFNSLGRELTSILDDDRRKEINERMLDLWEEEAPGTTLYYPYESFGVRTEIEWDPYSSQAMDFRPYNLQVR